ncbi:MAG: hypothetical protein ACLVDB_01815 [Anaeromassilibacillus sp.]
MSLSDGTPMMTMPVAPANNYGGGMGMWGQDWIWIIVLFLFGWGRNGFGGNGNNGVMDGYALTSDFANIERKLDAVNNGICDGFYAMNTGMLNGFAGVTQAVTSGFSAAELARCNQQAALMQQLNAMQMQNQECCCENRAAIAQVRYDMATQACDTRNTVNTAARDIIDNQNQNSRAILDFLTQSKLRICRAQIRAAFAGFSGCAEQLSDFAAAATPIPAYQSCNPWAGGTYTGCGCA